MIQFNQNFINSIAQELPKHLSMDDFITYSQKSLRLSIRVNTLKISTSEFITLMTPKGWSFEPIPWCDCGFWVKLDNPIQLGNSIEHQQGLFYIQEASSMLPPTALLGSANNDLNDKTPQTVLDMASAPGSKTTQIAALMQNKGLLVANEYSASRVKVLHANILRMGVANSALTHFDARVFGEYLFESFDQILLDAPCSGEGTIRKDPDALKNWSHESIASIAQTQKELIESAFLSLKVGGSLVYSTCALGQAENQAVCLYLQNRYPDSVQFESLAELFPGADKACTEDGFLHIWPQIYDSEGFFVAKITKTAAVERQKKAPKKQKNFPFTLAKTKQLEPLLNYLNESFAINLPDDSSVYIRDDEYWLFPNKMQPLIGMIRFQRIGFKLADALKKGFKVKHEAILALNQYQHSVTLTEAEAKAYLMGRDIFLTAPTKAQGEMVVTYQGHGLGVVKHLGNKLKNNLPRDLVKDKIATYCSENI